MNHENHDKCPKCGQETLPRFDRPEIQAVACQNKECRFVVNKKVE